MSARRVPPGGLARDAGIFEVLSGPGRCTRATARSGGVFPRLAADAPEWCGAGRAGPLPLEGPRERFLPGCALRGRQDAKLRYAVLAAAAVHGGTEPDPLEEAAMWQTDDFRQYAVHAAVACIRAAASRAGVPVHRHARTWTSTLATWRPSADSERLATECCGTASARRSFGSAGLKLPD